MHNLTYSPRAQKSFKKLPKDYQLLIARKIALLSDDPLPRGFDKIAAKNPPLFRIRIGNYRIFYFINQQEKQVIIVDIRRRTSQTYR